MKQSSLIQGLHFPYELQVISSENDMESFKSWKASSSLKEDKASPDIVWETGQTVPFESGLSILRWSNDASIELLHMQEQGCPFAISPDAQGQNFHVCWKFRPRSLSDIEKFRSGKVAARADRRGSEKFLVRRTFDLV